ncbi:RNA pseudouridine synthase [Bacteroides uniformis]|jgi:tRNA pseudouridine32 synthase/23S rRNA pseudouridine746 synthase|uniref:RluA family pseudouridine synthase n=1 Tax=Bacteroides TaxID=816 RepID=UPI001403C421|nr:MULTISPECIES: RluA family pseudouridine synthase [Bacteroides]MBV4215488.1 RNA pseudouridine synthase [Bacteroides uniformis]MBV4230403.1 RNA pseudouridine synthase [Bacteroides uniformis]MCB7403225.1 RNA pseudouridine synthase [Bacteroides uniformis]MCB7414573.1 RNA pseudouridine synthase [Bacteroides uniformis]
MLHRFTTSITDIPLPERFTYPFCYTPHPLCILAAKEVQSYLTRQTAWKDELRQGKMFGVLIVQTEHGETGYLAAFSGILAGKNLHPFFVPPVYDLLQPQGFFKIEEENISSINRNIRQLENDKAYAALSAELARTIQSAEDILATAKAQLKEAKTAREQRRKEKELNAQEEAELIRESQFQKAEYKRLERSWKARITTLQTQTEDWERRISALKSERKTRSAALQQKLFEQFGMLNYRGEVKNLCEIFGQTVHKTPPAGAGECAAPKLLQQAYLHGWKPIAMAEFWWGDSPKTEIRHHGHYYPACKGKCEPILQHMLQGLQVEENPMLKRMQVPSKNLEIVYEDPWLSVINKPAGMLSVPGKEDAVSVYSLMREQYPEADGPLTVHRLDMATSGLMLIAKTKRVHQNLQAQFKNRLVRKRYVALLEGVVPKDKGTVDLPLCLNPLDRPRQMVHTEHGKPAITDYQVLERLDGKRTRIAFYPRTGRTHQLRIHAAHPLGLHCPIIGDELYGEKADRLYLHAEYLEFTHPITGETVRITKEAEF